MVKKKEGKKADEGFTEICFVNSFQCITVPLHVRDHFGITKDRKQAAYLEVNFKRLIK